jgi:hypothetical protein
MPACSRHSAAMRAATLEVLSRLAELDATSPFRTLPPPFTRQSYTGNDSDSMEPGHREWQISVALAAVVLPCSTVSFGPSNRGVRV